MAASNAMAADSSSLRWSLVSASLMLLLLLLQGCTMEPRYRPPALPVSQQWPIPPTTETAATADAAGGDTAAAAPSGPAQGATEAATAASVMAWDIGWRDFFCGQRQYQLIVHASPHKCG